MTRTRQAMTPFLIAAVAVTGTAAQAACDRTPLLPPTVQAPHRVLFVGNSFLHGHLPPVLPYNAARVTDLNGTGYGGVPGVFKQLADDAGVPVDVASELLSGQALTFHLDEKRALIASRPWDIVVLQEYSLLSPRRPGDPISFVSAAARLEALVHGVNPAARVYLLETWARADQVYSTPGGRWMGKPLEAMQADLHAGYAKAMAKAACIADVLPVGDAALRAINDGVADRNPYDGITPGQVNLWGPDSYHLSAWGSYLEALVIFGRLTGRDPASLGAGSRAGRELGLTAAQIEAAQAVASRQLQAPHGGGVSAPAAPASPTRP
jgi:hypothetical protein